MQQKDETYPVGANKVCLRDARKNYLRIGACEPEMVKYTRKPEPDELPPANR